MIGKAAAWLAFNGLLLTAQAWGAATMWAAATLITEYAPGIQYDAWPWLLVGAAGLAQSLAMLYALIRRAVEPPQGIRT